MYGIIQSENLKRIDGSLIPSEDDKMILKQVSEKQALNSFSEVGWLTKAFSGRMVVVTVVMNIRVT